MSLTSWVLTLIVLVLAVPVGFLVSWFARDELVPGRVWLRMLVIVSVASVLWFWLTKSPAEALTSLFILIVSSVGLVKSKDHSWTRKRRF